MEAGNSREVQIILRDFKLPDGSPKFPVLYNIPNDSRIRDLAKVDFQRVNLLIIGALTVCFEGMNLKRGMNEMQILTLSETIIDSAGEDNLSFEDFMLFLQNMLAGKYDMTYESMDIPKFMRMFEIYRQERWSQWIKYNEDRHEQFKAIDRLEVQSNKNSPLGELLADYSNKLSAKNDEIKSLRQERKRQHDIDNF